MAATPKTMAEVLASSASLTSSNNNNTKNSNSGDYSKAGSNVNDSKEENGSSNILIKTFPYLTITVYIPTACVGVLIGKRGSNIDSIQKLAAKESTKTVAGGSATSSSRGARNKSAKQNKNNAGGGGNQRVISPESVRISVVNYPPPNTNAKHSFEHYKNLHMGRGDSGKSSASGQQQQQMGGSSMMDMGAPPTYTELDFSDPQWTPIVIRADPVAAIYAANAINDVCYPEYVVDRTLLVYILDVPVPAVASGNSNNANLRHASIVGKRGNKLIQLSVDHKCRIMVPPKQLGHNVIQLEAPLKECCSCLKGIAAKLQAGGPSANDDKDQQYSDVAKGSPTSTPSKNAKNNTAGNKANSNNNNKNKNENSKNNFQTTLIIQPLPSQTKLRNIARKTETKILKKRIPKSQQRHQKQQPQKPEQDQESKSTEQASEEVEASEQHQEKQEQGATNNSNNNNANSNNDNKVSWRLTVVANSEKKVMKAVDMLKVLNTKGYEVIVEGSVTHNTNDTSTKTVESMVGGSEDDADPGVATDSSTNGGAIDAPKATTPTGTPNGRSGGRGGRNKKQRNRGNHRGNNGKDVPTNNNSACKQQMTAAAAADNS